MKKILSLVLVAGMFAIYSCGSGSEQTEGTAADSAAVQEAAPAEVAPAAPADSAAMPADTTAH